MFKSLHNTYIGWLIVPILLSHLFFVFCFKYYLHFFSYTHSLTLKSQHNTIKKKWMNWITLRNTFRFIYLYIIFIQKWHLTNKRKTKNKHLHEWNFQGLAISTINSVQPSFATTTGMKIMKSLLIVVVITGS